MALKVKALALGAAVAMAACGGDDGSSGRDVGYRGSQAAVTLNAANVGSVAASASAQASALAGTEYGATPIGAARSGTRDVYEAALARVAAVRRTARATVAGVVQSGGMACDVSGSVSGVASDADGNDMTVHTGDYVQLSFDGCSFDGLETVWGSMRVEFTRADGKDPSDTPNYLTSGFEYGMRIVLDDFVIESATGDYAGSDGDVAMSMVWDAATRTLTSTLSGTSVANEAGNGSTVVESSLLAGIPGVSAGYSFSTIEAYDTYLTSVTGTQLDVTARACSLEMAGCVDLEVTGLVSAAGAYPSAGTMRFTGAAGAYVEIVVVDATGAITLEYDLDGPGATAAFGPISTTWACLDTPGFCQPE